jgi:hypothetical protein
MEGTLLHPMKRSDGVRVFDPREVETIARTRTLSGGVTSEGEIAARACELFREGKSAVDVVIELRQPFEVVQRLQRAFLSDSGSLILPGTVVAELATTCDLQQVTPAVLLSTVEAMTRKIEELVGTMYGAIPRKCREPATVAGSNDAETASSERVAIEEAPSSLVTQDGSRKSNG